MSRKTCILHANCQGDAIRLLLETSPDFNKFFVIQQYRNYLQEELIETVLQHCDLFLYQYLSDKWGNLSSAQLLNRLPDTAQVICLPNLFFKGYWPFWTNQSQQIDFADALLERLLEENIPYEMVKHIYLNGDVELFGDIKSVAKESINQEKEKEKYSPIKYVNIIEENWHTIPLFLTVNHPNNLLLLHIVNNLLSLLDLDILTKQVAKNFINPYADFFLPIHPTIATILGLKFVKPDQKFACFGSMLTFDEYITCYLACRKHGIKDIATSLRDLSRS